jgi:hypothetical protein
VSIIPPYPCFSKEHPSTTASSIRALQADMEYTRELFDGFSSEGCFDFAIKYIDYGLYVTFGNGMGEQIVPIADAFLPVWELTYHGVILYNCSSPTVNYVIKTPADRLKAMLWGGKPSFYIYSKFRTGGAPNWMGNDDLICTTDDDMKKTVSLICQCAMDFKPLAEKQTVYFSPYDVLENGMECFTYEDGTRVVGNYSDLPATFEGVTIHPWEYHIF